MQMNPITAATQYPIAPFEQFFYNSAGAYNQFYQQPAAYYPEFNKSESTSDESLNDGRVDQHKMSPKYREKRNKNNEAAKKSRLNRKAREKNLQDENNRLKMTIKEQLNQIEDLTRRLEAATSFNEQQQQSQHYGEQMLGLDGMMVLRDSTNQQIPPQQPPQMMAPPNPMPFNYKTL